MLRAAAIAQIAGSKLLSVGSVRIERRSAGSRLYYFVSVRDFARRKAFGLGPGSFRGDELFRPLYGKTLDSLKFEGRRPSVSHDGRLLAFVER
jgi:hypothetical protein